MEATQLAMCRVSCYAVLGVLLACPVLRDRKEDDVAM